jgi:hypothetical protein
MNFPMWGNVCFSCELEFNHEIEIYKGKVRIVGRKKDWIKAARGSGYYPLTFNFILGMNGRTVQCSYCGTWVNEKVVTRDHVYPKSRGGIIKTPACEPCNTLKEDMLPIEWAIFASKRGLGIAIIPIGFDSVTGEH